MPCIKGVDGLAQELGERVFCHNAGGVGRPDTFGPVAACFGTGALGDSPIQNHKTDGSLGQIIGQFNFRIGYKAQI